MTQQSPATLVAIIVAARRAGDRELERESRRRLRERFGVKLSFARSHIERIDSRDGFDRTVRSNH